MKKAVFLDRDGTIIVDKIYLNDVHQIEYLPRTFEALRQLRDHGYLLIIVTNQSGIARGIVSIENLYKIHETIRSDLSREGIDVAGFYYAPYSVESNHHIRKPNPGMLIRAADDFGVSIQDSFMIGDRDSDVEAGHRAGAHTILLSQNETLSKYQGRLPHKITKDLWDASEYIISISP